jgi:hypothetical protein
MNTGSQRKQHDGVYARVLQSTADAYKGVSSMQYILILTETAEGGIQVTIPALAWMSGGSRDAGRHHSPGAGGDRSARAPE